MRDSSVWSQCKTKMHDLGAAATIYDLATNPHPFRGPITPAFVELPPYRADLAGFKGWCTSVERMLAKTRQRKAMAAVHGAADDGQS